MSNHSQSSDNEEEDLTPIQYARLNGLSCDYLAEPMPLSHIDKLRKDTHDGLTDDSHLRQFNFEPELDTEERLSISKDAALLLASVAKEESVDWADSLVLSTLGSRDVKRMRVEEPFLKSDHKRDCKEFAKREGFEIKLKDVKLPSEIVNEENDEGLGWPSKFWSLGAEVMENLKQEKITVQRDTLVYLQNTLKATWTEEDGIGLWNRELKYKRNSALEPVTPPLSPISYPPEPYEPSSSSPGMQLTILSDPPSLIKEDLEAIEKRIFEQDIPTPLRKFKVTSLHDDSSSDTHVDGETVKLGDIYSPLASLDNTMISPRIESHRVKLEDLNVEEPLTPPILIPAPPKAVHFSNIIEEMLLDHPSSSRSDILEDSFFNDAFGDAAERAKRQLEQETLIEADSTARVEVPFVDFSLPNPPWKILQEHFTNSTILLAKQKSVIVDIVGTDNPEWPGVKQLDFQLRWTPFPHNLAEIAVEEDFQSNDATWEVFVEDPDDSEVIDSSSLTWKPPGLRILRDEDDHDEIELGKFKTDNPLDILFLVKKRKMELEEGGSFSQNVAREEAGDAAGSTSNVSLVVKQQLRKSTPKPGSFTSAPPKSQLDQTQDQGLSLLLGGPFSTHNSLQNYLELRGSKKPKLMDSFCFATNNGQAQTPTQPVESRLPQQDIVQLPTRKPPIAKADPLPSPDIRVPTEPVNIIVASTLLKHRALIKYLEAQIPSLTLLERDFAAHNTTVWLPGSVTRSPIASPLASEADIGVSSSTGIVITTLQRIKQKPLPGQKTKPSIRDRVEKVSLRYEKLVVLVSEERTDETTNGLDDNDCLAFSEFVGFTLGLEAAVTVQFVGGGEETLSKWLESAIIQNGPIGESILLEEETHWELFLRRAGMNTFAAQEIIIALKAPDGVDPSSPTKVGQFGLTAFVEMNREHRINRFCHLCGKKLLERVSAVVDSKWE